MLVLSRKEGESVVITDANGSVIKVFVTKVEYNQVKLGIEAPTDFKIFRQELYDQVNRS